MSPHRVISPIMDRATTATSYTVSVGTAGAGLLSLNEWALLLGIIFAALTFAVNWWYQHRKFSMDRERHIADQHYHAARMERIKADHIEPYTAPDEASGD